MALTGFPDGAPSASPASAFALLQEVTSDLAAVTGVRADPAELITGRAALTGFTRHGQVSAGGSTRLLRATDGWCAVTLSRPEDMDAVPAILGTLGSVDPPETPWAGLEAAARAVTAADLADAAQLLGVPAAALPAAPPSAPWPPWRATRIAAPSPGMALRSAVVVDLSSMWAGPLCARLLGLAGARVIKVESPDRPDGARSGNQPFYDWLHAGHESIALNFRTPFGLHHLSRLLVAADVVIEGSRPRALANLGVAPGMIAHRPGQVWLSITGHGRDVPGRVAFGDDAAVAGGLVGWARGEPVFCADAVGDPLTGACGALAVAKSLAAGGGELIDLPMRTVAAAFAAATVPDHGPHEFHADAAVECQALGLRQLVLPPHAPAVSGTAPALGADTDAVLAWLWP
jgi:hypothetical protein